MSVGQVGDVNVVAHAGAVRGRVVVAEDGRRLALLQAVEQHRDEVEDRGVLQLHRTTSGHVEVAQRAEADAERLLAGACHPLAEQLGLAVGVDRQHRDDVLRHHIDRRHTIGGGGRGEDELLGVLGLGHAGEHVEHAVDVLLVVPQRLLDGFADLLARGEVDDGIDVFGVEDLGEAVAGARRGDIHAIQPRAFDAGGLSVAQIVDDDNAFAGLMERMDDVGTDVSAPTGNENCHVCPFVTASITIGIRDD